MILHATNDQVAVAWIASIPGFTADGVGTQLPTDTSTWETNGFVVVPTSVGGTPHQYMPVRRPVCQVECWAVEPGSDDLPWLKASQLAEQIRLASYDRIAFGRPLALTAGPVIYPGAVVKAATLLTEPRRVWSDAGDYAGYLFNLLLHWVEAGETVA